MIVLHAGLVTGRLHVWGERPAGPAPARRPGRPPKNPRPATSPYDAGKDALATALSTADLPQGRRDTEAMVAWLPTVDGAPAAGSPLVAPAPDPRAAPRLLAWTVTTLPLSPEDAVDLLCACVNKETLAPGVVIGKDLAFWSAALRLAGALVARQQFLPGLVAEDGVWRAAWSPAIVGADAERLSRLARAMPAVCRALSRKSDSPPEAAPLPMLTGFVGLLVDRLVRGGQPEARAPEARGRARRREAPSFESPHDEWLHALRSEDGRMQGRDADLARLASQVGEWQRPVAVSSAQPFRLSFRLEEPGGASNGTWFVRYLLQGTHDPSLLIPAEEAWTPRGAARSVLARAGFEAREYLLTSLGQASGICPDIEESLRAPRPGGYAADAAGAHAFLARWSPALAQSGFGVMLPAWWTGKGTKLRFTARANVRSPKLQGRAGLGDALEFDWEVALGGERLSLEELEALARLKAPLVRVRGQWVEMDADEIRAALEIARKGGRGSATVREIVQMALGGGSAPGTLAFEGVEATGWVGDLLGQLEGRKGFGELPPPPGLVGSLRPYQLRGYSWLSFLARCGLGACLADDMGLGKTIQMLALIEKDWSPRGKRPTLLVCPMSVVGNWQKEAARFTPDLPVLVHHGLERTRGAGLRKTASKHAVVVTSYALLHRDLAALAEVPWSAVVLDEAQNIKNPETKQAKAARSIAAPRRIALTGTPVENNVGDLWSIMEFLNPGFLGSQAEFKKTFFVPIQAMRDASAMERLRRLTGPFVLRRLKTDKTIIADLPEKMEMKVFCNLTREQASLYAAVVREAEEALDGAGVEGIQRKGIILATLSKLKQVCNHPAQLLGDGSAIPGRSGKLSRLTEMIEELLEVDDRALVFSQFSEMGGILKRHLEESFGREALFLHGGVNRGERDRMVERFQSEGGPSLFVLSLKAGGTGLNLTRANHVFHFDRWWNPAVEGQATDRAFRIGQTRRVQVHKFLCAGTIEEKIDEMIEAKKAVAESVVGAGEAWLTELTTEQLKEVFALRAEAVGD